MAAQEVLFEPARLADARFCARYTATFMFKPGKFDDEYYRLDARIAEVAKQLPGYLGEDAWENPKTGLVSTVYYWDSLESLQQLVSHPLHLQAKAAQSRWLAGYQVIIAQVLRTYGDARLSASASEGVGNEPEQHRG